MNTTKSKKLPSSLQAALRMFENTVLGAQVNCLEKENIMTQ